MKYGMPYKGSKNAIAEWIVNQLPEAECLVDLFGGGGAITHAALVARKYSRCIYNEISKVVSDAFSMAVNGKFKGEKRWISREAFDNLKHSDPYAAFCFSFSNNLDGYCYSKEVEHWKRALHYARVFADVSEFEKFGIHTDGSRSDIIAHKSEYKKRYIAWYVKNVMKSEKEYNLEKAELETKIQTESEKLRAFITEKGSLATSR